MPYRRIASREDLLSIPPLFDDKGNSLCQGALSTWRMKVEWFGGETSYRDGKGRRNYRSVFRECYDLLIELQRDFACRMQESESWGYRYWKRECKAYIERNGVPFALLYPRPYGYRVHYITRGRSASWYLSRIGIETPKAAPEEQVPASSARTIPSELLEPGEITEPSEPGEPIVINLVCGREYVINIIDPDRPKPGSQP